MTILDSPDRPWVHLMEDREFRSIETELLPTDGRIVHRISGADMRARDELFYAYKMNLNYRATLVSTGQGSVS
ncbi:hypothetical protein ABH922_001086 [Rhodococcus sp. 27YEA15]